MSRTVKGWAFVAIQAPLLGALIATPGGDNWPTPTMVEVMGQILVVVGLAVIAAGALRLGPALTATPMPRAGGRLAVDGLYRFVRHPIYSGVLTIVLGITLRSGNVAHVAVAIATYVFFAFKARWEEARLAEQYPDYPAYAAVTPRLIPRLWAR